MNALNIFYPGVCSVHSVSHHILVFVNCRTRSYSLLIAYATRKKLASKNELISGVGEFYGWLHIFQLLNWKSLRESDVWWWRISRSMLPARVLWFAIQIRVNFLVLRSKFTVTMLKEQYWLWMLVGVHYNDMETMPEKGADAEQQSLKFVLRIPLY